MTIFTIYANILSAFQIGEERVNDMSERETTNSASRDDQRTERDEITFKILEHIGVLRTNATGWSRELNYVSWCDRPARFDIRDWTPDHEKSTRGITLTDYEMAKICEWMDKRKKAQEGM